jgi:hypothetical protein
MGCIVSSSATRADLKKKIPRTEKSPIQNFKSAPKTKSQA